MKNDKIKRMIKAMPYEKFKKLTTKQKALYLQKMHIVEDSLELKNQQR